MAVSCTKQPDRTLQAGAAHRGAVTRGSARGAGGSRADRADRADNAEQVHRADRAERIVGAGRAGGIDRADRAERIVGAGRAGRIDRADRAERIVGAGRAGPVGHVPRPDRTEHRRQSSHAALAPEPPLVLGFSRTPIATLDALAATLAARMHRLARPLARAAEAFVRQRGWFDLGYARAEDFARERLGRSGRWLRDHAALGRATLRSDRLLRALDGTDGGPPLGSVAAVAIARGTDTDFLPTWIAIARAVGVRELKRRLRQARAAECSFPVDDNGRRDDTLRPPDPLIEELASWCPEALAGPAFFEAAALPWNRRHLEALGFPIAPHPPADIEEGIRDPQTRALAAWAREHFPGPGTEDGPDSDAHEPRATIRIDLPAAAAAAFFEVRELHRCVCGARTGTTGFVEALVAEARAAGLDPHPDLYGALDRLRHTDPPDEAERESTWDRRRRAWNASPPPASSAIPAEGAARALHPPPSECPPRAPQADFPPVSECSPSVPRGDSLLPSERFPCAPQADLPPASGGDPTPGQESEAGSKAMLRRADDLLRRADRLFLRAGEGDAKELAAQLRELVGIEQDIRRVLGDLLAALARCRAWPALGFNSIRHYAEARLGLSRSGAEDLATLARALRHLQVVEEAREAGRLSCLAALRVVRILGRELACAELQQEWVAHAESTTIKRLDDERDALRLRRLLATTPEGRSAHPLTDADWHHSLGRLPGETTARIGAFVRLADERPADIATLRLVLPFGIAADFLGALEAAARRVRTFSAGLAPFDARWLGLYALLTSYVASHDIHRGPRGVYARDGWRCMAPGCTSSAHLEDHHVLYRARGGDDEPDNRVTLCRYHHQRGEHGGAMRVRGQAPLGLVFELDGIHYRNERVLS